MWAEAEIDTGFPVEFALLVDLDNDGKAQEVLPQAGSTQTPLAWYEAKAGSWVKHVVSAAELRPRHRRGRRQQGRPHRHPDARAGGSKRPPIRARGPWTFHPDWETVNVTPPAPGAPATPTAAPRLTDSGFMHVADVNGDGRNDVIAGGGARLRRVLVRAGRGRQMDPPARSTARGRRRTPRRWSI